MKKPNFFIIGAPKCGTTSLSVYLSQHPNICFSEPKEPHFFSTDLPKYTLCKTEKAYLAKFCCDKSEVKRVGEGSTWYMYSKHAVNNILDFNKDAKIIAMIRNPVEVAESLYYQFSYGHEEDAPSFEEAWKLQESRLSGANIPTNIVEPERLQYRKVCALGSQLKRLIETVPEKQLKIIIFDDFISDTKSVYEDVLDFLHLSTDERIDFPKVNESKTHRSKYIANLTQQPSGKLDPLVKWVKDRLGIKRIGLTNYLRSINQKKNIRAPLPEAFVSILYANFKSEILLIESLLNRELKDWHI